MPLYDIVFLIFIGIMLGLIFLGVSKNTLTEYGVGLLICILVLGIIGYNIWMDITVWDASKNIKACP
jgi:hypothetical protein